MTSGIYAIINTINNKQYIGSSVNIEERWKRHIRLLDRNRHHSLHLQHAWNKYGQKRFEFVILFECDPSNLLDNEQCLIDCERPEYNISPTAGRVTGIVRSEEYRRKQRVSQSGKQLSEEVKEKISNGMRGKRNSLGRKNIISQKTKGKISDTLKGHVVSEETRRKIGAKNRKYRHTNEAKRKISESLMGNKRARRYDEDGS